MGNSYYQICCRTGKAPAATGAVQADEIAQGVEGDVRPPCPARSVLARRQDRAAVLGARRAERRIHLRAPRLLNGPMGAYPASVVAPAITLACPLCTRKRGIIERVHVLFSLFADMPCSGLGDTARLYTVAFREQELWMQTPSPAIHPSQWMPGSPTWNRLSTTPAP